MLSIVVAILLSMLSAFATVNFGGTRMSTSTLTASGLSQAHLRDLSEGYVDHFNVHITMGLVQSTAGGGFSAVVTAGATEGTDDMDLLLNGLFSSMSLYWEAGNVAYNGLTPAQLRTALVLFNRRDLEGTFINGAAIPTGGGSATSYRITLPIPVSLRNYFEDGDIFGSGTHRMYDGRFDFNVGTSLTPTIALHSGSAVVSSLAVNIGVAYGDGDASDTGPTWRVRRPGNLKYIGEKFPACTRIGLLDMTANASTDVTAYSFLGYRTVTPADFASRWQADRQRDGGGYDLSARCVPLIFPSPGTKLLDFTNVTGAEWTRDVISTDAAATIMDVWAVDPDPVTFQTVASKTAHGGATTTTVIRPHSFSQGDSVPTHLAGLVKYRARPGKLATGAHASTPVQAGHVVANSNAKALQAVSARNAARVRRR